MSSLKEMLDAMGCEFDEAHLYECEAKGWLHPETARAYDAMDVARARLIHTMRSEMEIDEEAMPVILLLLDQLHGTRHLLRRLTQAIALQPDELRAEIAALLHE